MKNIIKVSQKWKFESLSASDIEFTFERMKVVVIVVCYVLIPFILMLMLGSSEYSLILEKFVKLICTSCIGL